MINSTKELNMSDEIMRSYIDAACVSHWRNEAEPVYGFDIIDEINGSYPSDPNYYVFEAAGYQAHEGKYGLIILNKSPYFTYGEKSKKFEDLAMMIYGEEQNQKCYCFGPEFYDRFRIPHDIFDVETGDLIHKNKWIKIHAQLKINNK
jgi:hypothetical protein